MGRVSYILAILVIIFTLDACKKKGPLMVRVHPGPFSLYNVTFGYLSFGDLPEWSTSEFQEIEEGAFQFTAVNQYGVTYSRTFYIKIGAFDSPSPSKWSVTIDNSNQEYSYYIRVGH